MLTENWVTNVQKNWWFFQQSWNLFPNFGIKMEGTATYFSLFTGLCLADASKCMKLFAITWTCHNLSFILNALIVWNIAQISWFSPWRYMFNSFKWAIKFTKNAKSVSYFSSSSSHTNFPFDSTNYLISFLKSQNLFSILPQLSHLPSEK